MRMRRKPYARPELAAWVHHIDAPGLWRGNWKAAFEKDQPLWLELGCGKGGFAARLALQHPEINLIAVDIKSEVLVVAKRTIERLFAEAGKPIENVKIMSQEIGLIERMLSPEDVIERIYINFCNPWSRQKHKKKRLTHTRQLIKYRDFLKDGGKIYFKTDDKELFEESLGYFAESGFEIVYLTIDLANSDYEQNIETEHEKMFAAEGKKAMFLIAQKNDCGQRPL